MLAPAGTAFQSISQGWYTHHMALPLRLNQLSPFFQIKSQLLLVESKHLNFPFSVHM